VTGPEKGSGRRQMCSAASNCGKSHTRWKLSLKEKSMSTGADGGQHAELIRHEHTLDVPDGLPIRMTALGPFATGLSQRQ
jgi:hypothetical protein